MYWPLNGAISRWVYWGSIVSYFKPSTRLNKQGEKCKPDQGREIAPLQPWQEQSACIIHTNGHAPVCDSKGCLTLRCAGVGLNPTCRLIINAARCCPVPSGRHRTTGCVSHSVQGWAGGRGATCSAGYFWQLWLMVTLGYQAHTCHQNTVSCHSLYRRLKKQREERKIGEGSERKVLSATSRQAPLSMPVSSLLPFFCVFFLRVILLADF